MKKTAILGALLGAAISGAVWVAYMFFGYIAGPETLILWPGSFPLLGIRAEDSISFVIALWLICGVVNVGTYALLALAVHAMYRRVVRNRHGHA